MMGGNTFHTARKPQPCWAVRPYDDEAAMDLHPDCKYDTTKQGRVQFDLQYRTGWAAKEGQQMQRAGPLSAILMAEK
jgi:hypothetical protein